MPLAELGTDSHTYGIIGYTESDFNGLPSCTDCIGSTFSIITVFVALPTLTMPSFFSI